MAAGSSGAPPGVRFTPLLGVGGGQPLSYLLELAGFAFLLDCGWSDAYDVAQLAPVLAVLPRVDAGELVLPQCWLWHSNPAHYHQPMRQAAAAIRHPSRAPHLLLLQCCCRTLTRSTWGLHQPPPPLPLDTAPLPSPHSRCCSAAVALRPAAPGGAALPGGPRGAGGAGVRHLSGAQDGADGHV